MTISEALEYLTPMRKEASRKSEIRLFRSFIEILSDIKEREFDRDEMVLIETHLDGLIPEDSIKNNMRHLRRRLAALKRFLKDKFSLITDGFYTNLGIGLGIVFGVALGSALFKSDDGTSGNGIGLAIGMVIGLVIGKALDMKARKEGRVLNAKD